MKEENRVSDYLRYLSAQDHTGLFSDDAVKRLQDLEPLYQNRVTHEVLYGIRLDSTEEDIDFSVRVDTPEETSDRIKTHRADDVHTELDTDEVISAISEIGWKGDKEYLKNCLHALEPYTSGNRFRPDFEITEGRILDSTGINMVLRSPDPSFIERFLDLLKDSGLCPDDKAEGIMDWVRMPPMGHPYIQNDISHFKIITDTDGTVGIKAYLRQGDEKGFSFTKTLFAPFQMNLELTTQCPLHCPQCYVSLYDGEHLDREKALYFIREAAKAGVYSINLSGGETLAYPWLDDLIKECSRLKLFPVVALSGAYVTKERLIALIEAGVEGIFVSLNGSTEEINRKSRDGYSLAIKTLEYLKDLSYPETYINFVMQKSNARDLPKMMKLAEKYGVKELVIISFKPDSAKRLDAFPDRAQLEEAAAFIRSYKGPVKLSVEGCFSILRALSREMFFFNLNRGIGYGCGAGRDGISVNIKGQLTPCRHLDLPEDNDSIMDYWRNSPVLKKLRSIEDMRDEPCRGCHYEKACLPCAAVANELRGDIMTGFKECPVALRD